MENNMRESIKMEKNMVKAISNGQMVVNTKDNSMIIGYKVKGNISGLMVEDIQVIGIITKCMVMEYLDGQMVKNMKETM